MQLGILEPHEFLEGLLLGRSHGVMGFWHPSVGCRMGPYTHTHTVYAYILHVYVYVYVNVFTYIYIYVCVVSIQDHPSIHTWYAFGSNASVGSPVGDSILPGPLGRSPRLGVTQSLEIFI